MIEGDKKLLSPRKLSKHLQLSKNTVEAAYEQLYAEGHIRRKIIYRSDSSIGEVYCFMIIRLIKDKEIYLLKDFLYEAIFQQDENNLLPREVIKQPELSVFIDDFGKKDDHCLVAECEGKIVGAVWVRILSGEVKGFGNVDNETPEFAISLYKEYRNKGIGTELMKNMLQLLKEQGYKQTSLAVQKDNYAAKMYQKVGFKIVKQLEEEYLMICDLKLANK